MLMPCFLKPSSLAVLFDDKSQTPPHQPRILRPSQKGHGNLRPVQTHELQDLHMSIAISPYRPLMQKSVPIKKWLEKLFDLLKEREHFVDDQSLPTFSAYESDEQDVVLGTSRHLDGLLNQAEATCMKQCSLPGLLFITCCRLPPTVVLLSGFQYYPTACGSTPGNLRQGPLPSLDVCFQREKIRKTCCLVFFLASRLS